MPTLALSPCPNDTFAFYGLLHQKTRFPETLHPRFADIEELNHLCFEEAVDFCKISFHTYVLMRDRYQLLNAGSALGFGCGPLLVAKRDIPRDQWVDLRIAVPGRHTTANLLLQLMLGPNLQLEEMVFDQIMPAVAKGDVDAGLIIHESRFTYQHHGLVSLVDLGDWWEHTTGSPIPLGGIVAHRRVPTATVNAFDAALADSVRYAWQHGAEVVPFMQQHAQEMDPHVMQAHVDLYVNRFTENLGQEGRHAIDRLVDEAAKLGIRPQ